LRTFALTLIPTGPFLAQGARTPLNPAVRAAAPPSAMASLARK
jgi:hypothetical protein